MRRQREHRGAGGDAVVGAGENRPGRDQGDGGGGGRSGQGGGLQGERGRLLDWGNGIEYYNIVKITR